jgi:hypothetical protein
MSKIIKDLPALKDLIQKSVTEAVSTLLPEDAPPQQNPVAAPSPAPQTAPVPSQQPSGTQVSPGKIAAGQAGSTDSGTDLQKGSITLEMIVEKLNSIRSGRSLKDDNISQQMQAYFNDLNDNERLALYAFLKGIAQIVTGEIQGQVASTPQTASPAVEMIDAGEGNIRHVKPNIIKKAPVASTQKSPAPENTSAPLPIVPKQR